MDIELLREAIRAAETHDWIQGRLMIDRKDRMVISTRETLLARAAGTDYKDAEEIGCDEVAACCAVGFLRFADLCLLPVTGSAGSDALQEQLEQVLWRRPEVREASQRWLNESEFWGDDPADVAEHAEVNGLSSIGEEGLLAFWNDTVATSKDDIVALFREALESLTPA